MALTPTVFSRSGNGNTASELSLPTRSPHPRQHRTNSDITQSKNHSFNLRTQDVARIQLIQNTTHVLSTSSRSSSHATTLPTFSATVATVQNLVDTLRTSVNSAIEAQRAANEAQRENQAQMSMLQREHQAQMSTLIGLITLQLGQRNPTASSPPVIDWPILDQIDHQIVHTVTPECKLDSHFLSHSPKGPVSKVPTPKTAQFTPALSLITQFFIECPRLPAITRDNRTPIPYANPQIPFLRYTYLGDFFPDNPG